MFDWFHCFTLTQAHSSLKQKLRHYLVPGEIVFFERPKGVEKYKNVDVFLDFAALRSKNNKFFTNHYLNHSLRALLCFLAVISAFLFLRLPAYQLTRLFAPPTASAALTQPTSIITLRNDATGGDCPWVGVWNDTLNVCTLSGNVNANIIIQHYGITLDGDNHRIAGNGTGTGILVSYVGGVAIKNVTVELFSTGIKIEQAQGVAGSTLDHVTTDLNSVGMILSGSPSSPTTLTDSQSSHNTIGIQLAYSGNLVLLKNALTDNTYHFEPATDLVHPGLFTATILSRRLARFRDSSHSHTALVSRF